MAGVAKNMSTLRDEPPRVPPRPAMDKRALPRTSFERDFGPAPARTGMSRTTSESQWGPAGFASPTARDLLADTTSAPRARSTLPHWSSDPRLAEHDDDARCLSPGLMAPCRVGLLAAGRRRHPQAGGRAAAVRRRERLSSFVVPASVEPALVLARRVRGDPRLRDLHRRLATNHDWAKLVLLMGEFPLTDSNVTVVTRWMRQENYVDAWWPPATTRSTNGWGSGGRWGHPAAMVCTLVDAARECSEAPCTPCPAYREIVGITLQASAPTEQVERAICVFRAGGQRACTTTARTGPTTTCR